MENRKQSAFNWIIGMILCPLGVCFSVKSGFGVSMIEAPVYVLYRFFSRFAAWYTFGTSEYVVQGILLAALCIAIRRFRWKYLLSFATAFVYGLILDGWYGIFGSEVYASLAGRIAAAVVGMTVTALAVAFFFRTDWPQEVWELFVKELAERYSLNMTKVKWIYDCSSLAAGVILMLVLLGGFDFAAIGIGTLVTTLVNAPVIGFWGKLIDKAAGKQKKK